jgi:hypothetical protein
MWHTLLKAKEFKSRSPPQYSSCKKISHVAKKEEGHIIKDCYVCPQNRSALAFHTAIQSTFMPTSSAQPAVPRSSNITPKQVQQMIISALSTLGLQSKKNLLTSPWLIDSMASNHMTGSLAALHDFISMIDCQSNAFSSFSFDCAPL